MNAAKKPWWQTATALVTVSAGGAITGFSFVPGTPDAVTSPAGLPLHLLALDKAAHAQLPANVLAAGDPSGQDALLRSAIVNVARFYLWQAKTRTPAQVEALIWGETSLDGADHGESCAAFASLTLQLAAQAVGQQSWVTGGDSYPWPLHSWADVRVDPNPASLNITSVVQDATAHGRWHPAGDGYVPQPGDWVLFPGHVEVVTGYSDGVLDTIGADSLPGLTINAHSFGTPLSAQGVEGFVDNGHLDGAGTGARPSSGGAAAAAAAGAERPTRSQPAGHGSAQRDGRASGGQRDAGLAQVPGLLEATGTGGASGGQRNTGLAQVPGLLQATGTGGATSPPARPMATEKGSEAGSGTGLAAIPGVFPTTAGPAELAAGSAAPVLTGTAPGGRGHDGGLAQIPGVIFPGTGNGTGSRAAAAPPARPAAPAHAAGPYRKYTAAETGTAPGTRAQQAFINEVAPGAMAAQRRFGVPASVTIAQAIEESAWGGSSLAAVQHNLFGIKGTGPAGSVLLPTSEFLNGNWETVNAPFRVYHNIAESIADHAELLATSGYYQRAMADRAVPDAFAHDLTGVYATDPEYGANLVALMRLYNLYRFDAPTSAAPAAAASTPAAQAPAAQAPAAQAPAAPGSTAGRTAGSAGAGFSGPGAAGASQGTGNVRSPGVPTPGPSRVGEARVPGVVAPATVPYPAAFPAAPAAFPAAGVARPTAGAASVARGAARVPGVMAPARLTAAPRYHAELPRATATAFFATAKGPLARAEPLYRDVAGETGIRWELLAACDWMQCKAHPGRSPVHGEKLGTLNVDRTSFRTKSGALAQAASDLVQLAAWVYAIDLTAPTVLSVRALADAFAAFRWGELLRRHQVSAMEFPYAVAGLTDQHLRMHWPAIDEPDAPDRPGARFRESFGAVPVVLSLGYPATV